MKSKGRKSGSLISGSRNTRGRRKKSYFPSFLFFNLYLTHAYLSGEFTYPTENIICVQSMVVGDVFFIYFFPCKNRLHHSKRMLLDQGHARIAFSLALFSGKKKKERVD